jgi:hypothetical protein
MNDPSQHDQPPWVQREWAAQERARQEERLALDASASDPLVRRYRLAAQRLRQPLPEVLPPDFAAQVADTVRARRNASDTRLEQGLLIGLCGLLGSVAAVIASSYAAIWLPAVLAVLPSADPSSRWLLLIFAGCAGVSYLLGRGQARGAG